MVPPPRPPRELRPLDPQVWRCCAGIGTGTGTGGWIPTAGTGVYYFPQGHAEQSSSTPNFSALPHPRPRPFIRCLTTAVTLLANTDTDEVYAKILLDPRPSPVAPAPSPKPPAPTGPVVEFFPKILTPSDANNGGGFSVPRFCAVSIFPPLDFTIDTPAQNLSVRDVHGTLWTFRHIYRGTPRRHLLTTGWSNFVNSKKLVAGDSVVFVKDQHGELFVGIRRTSRSCGRSSEYMRYNHLAPPPLGDGVRLREEKDGREGFSRNVKGRVPPESVVEAVRLAEMNRPFEVIYYPRIGSPNFVVGAEVVEAAMRVGWTSGMRVRMSVETEDSSRMTWSQGIVSGTADQDPVLWPHSPWRMLRVTWDETEALKNAKNVNPWQVELDFTTLHVRAPYPAIKKLRTSSSLEQPNDVEGNLSFPLKEFNRAGNSTPHIVNHITFPAGMQGARHDSSESNFFNLVHKSDHQLYFGNLNGSKIPGNVSTELSIGISSQSQSPSPQSLSSGYDDTQLFDTVVNNSNRTSKVSFQLFGQIIQTEQPFNDDAEKEIKMAEDANRSVIFGILYRCP